MSKYTAEQIRACILAYKSGDLNYCRSGIIDLLTDYASIVEAAHLARQSEGVSEEVVERLCAEFYAAIGTVPWNDVHEETKKAYRYGMRAALKSVRPPVGVSDDRLHKAIDTLLWINEEVWPLVHGLTSRETLRKRFRELPSLIEYLASRHAPTKD